MKFQLISDIHLEFWKTIPEVIPKAEYLILAGDIGYPTMDSFSEFMEQCVSKFKKVFYIPGNHEYYCTNKNKDLTKDDIDVLLNDLSNKIGFINLNNKTYYLQDIKIIGSTLWTECNEKNHKILKLFMNDYNYIRKNKEEYLTPWETGYWHYNSVNFLKTELNENIKKLVITHHLPSSKFIHPKYLGHLANCGFYSDLEYLFDDSILAWCGGHTHEQIINKINNTQILVNPIGYPNERKNIDWEFCFEI